MPVCGGLSIDKDTDVLIIDARARDTRSNILIGPQKRGAGFLNIHVKPTGRPLTVVLSHYNPMVFRFTGATNSVKHVIALGARLGGWDHVAVTGIEPEKLTFVPTIGRSKKLFTRCGRPPQSCVPVQYFETKWKSMYPIDKLRQRLSVDNHYIVTRGASITVPRAPGYASRKLNQWRAKRGKRILKYPSIRNWRHELARYRAKFGPPIAKIDVSELSSPTLLANDDNPPSWEGIAKLMAEKQIRVPLGYDQDKDLINFSDRFSRQFRSRLDPDFSFRPPIDFVMEHSSRSTPMPRDLHALSTSPGHSIVFLAKGRIPKGHQFDRASYCFFFLNEYYDRQYASHPRRCNWNNFGRGPYSAHRWSAQDKTRQVLKAARSAGGYKDFAKRRPCRLVDVPKDAKVIALATASGRNVADLGSLATPFCQAKPSIDSAETGQNLDNDNPSRSNRVCKFGRVNVEIDVPGRTFIVLKGRSAIDWKFKISKHSEVVGVLSVSKLQQIFSGLPVSAKVQHIVPGDRSLHGNCRHLLLQANPLAGGPTVQLFDKMFNWISGRSIDRLISKGPPPPKESQTPDNIARYTKFIVD